jgi:hypothetical protein
VIASKPQSPNRRIILGLLLAALAVLVVGSLIVAAIASRPNHPEVLNEPTRARQVLPFTLTPDPLFDPLPIEPEKHADEK